MCEDCGCTEGNERAYFGTVDGGHVHPHDHEHVHDHEHPHEHGHTHDHVHLHEESGEIHIHVYGDADNALNIHLHDHRTTLIKTHEQSHDHGHDHVHISGDSHELESEKKRTRTIELETSVLAVNDRQAEINRKWLDDHGVVAINLISSPGSGKTLLLEKTLEQLQGVLSCAVITGDQQTDNDAKRMEGKGAPVVQIETRSACHLNALQIFEQLEGVVKDGVKLLFIENVGNLVCPAAFDLGEQHKIALVSVAEGEDKPVKYPVLFHDAPVAVITKIDLLPHLDVDINKYKASVKQIRPDAAIFPVSSKSGEGMTEWLSYLKGLIRD